MEPQSVAAGVLAYVSSKEVLGKIIGPSADVVGDELKRWTEEKFAKRRAENVGRILKNAEEKLCDRLEEGGGVHFKVLHEILDDGSFAEDQLAVEYFGGVLASSRTGVPRDDRGASLAKLVGRLSSYQLRAHFFFYRVFKVLYGGSELTAMDPDGRAKMNTFIGIESFAAAMEFTTDEDIEEIGSHILTGLYREQLMDQNYAFGPVEYLRRNWGEAPGYGLMIGPSVLGIELFSWAHGMGHVHPALFLRHDVKFASDTPIKMIKDIVPVNLPDSGPIVDAVERLNR